MFFGDTFSEQVKGEGSGRGNWRSNVCAYSSDFDLSDGLKLDGWLTQGGRELAKQIIPSMMTDGFEMTTIPTGAIEIGGTLYVLLISYPYKRRFPLLSSACFQVVFKRLKIFICNRRVCLLYIQVEHSSF